MGEPSLVVLLGSKGGAGKMHIHVYRHLNVTIRCLDIVDGPIRDEDISSIPWSEAIVDVCTPTAAHVESLTWAYALGARKFILEKPAASSYAAWRDVLPKLDGALIFVTHPYLFSEGFQRAVDLVPDVVEIDSVFDKDRALDDARHRGADIAGVLPHVLQIEGPHQFSMLLAIAPTLAVSQVHARHHGPRGASPVTPLDCSVTMKNGNVRRATLSTDLRAPRKRSLRLAGDSGDSVTVHFSTTSELVARVERQRRSGAVEVVWSGRDDILQRTLASALEAIRSGQIPWEASPAFSSIVLARLDDAMAQLSVKTDVQCDRRGLHGVRIASPVLAMAEDAMKLAVGG